MHQKSFLDVRVPSKMDSAQTAGFEAVRELSLHLLAATAQKAPAPIAANSPPVGVYPVLLNDN